MPILDRSSDNIPTASSEADMPAGASVRALKIVVVVMGALIAIGLALVIGRVIALATKPARQAPATVGGQVANEARLSLPAGAAVKSIALSGDRLVVHYESADGRKGGIAVVDAATGETLTRIEIVPTAP